MRLLPLPLAIGLALTIASASARGQSANAFKGSGPDTALKASPSAADAEAKPGQPVTTPEAKPAIRILLVGGGSLEVEGLRQTADGFWYERGNMTSFLDKARVERVVRAADIKTTGPSETAASAWSIADAAKVENFYRAKFARSLPVTAFGQSELHTRWGLNHHQGIDVGLHPDSAEGKELINFLRTERIPFLAFRGAIPGVATGPHIHIGKGSHRLSGR